MVETRIYVGLNDSKTKIQKYETDKYVNILKSVCCSYKIPFSFSLAQGGYIHENGEYTEETTLVISLIDVNSDLIEDIARDLCLFFNQESVLITEGTVNAYYISESVI